MKIAIKTSPLNSLHAGRGIGQYTELLIEGLKKFDQKNMYVYFNDNLTEKVDVVHYPFFDIFQTTLRFIKNTKTVVTVHDLIPLKYPDKFPAGVRGKIAWWIQKSRLKKVDAIITDSQASANDIVRIVNVNRSKIQVVPLTVASDYKELSSSELAKLDLKKYRLPKKFILYVGDVNWNKNIPGMLKAFTELIKENEFSDYELVLVGSAFIKKDLAESQQINKIVDEEHIEDRVKMVGFVPIEDLVGIYNLATVYVQPSLDEGFGLPALQALACGTVTLSSNRGSLPEVVGEAGFYFDPTSIEDMVKTLKKVLILPNNEREKCVKMGLKQAKMFTLEKLATQTISAYESAVASDVK